MHHVAKDVLNPCTIGVLLILLGEQTMSERYIVKDIRTTQYSGLRKIREPWLVVDTTDSRIIDEFNSKRAATMLAREMNSQVTK